MAWICSNVGLVSPFTLFKLNKAGLSSLSILLSYAISGVDPDIIFYRQIRPAPELWLIDEPLMTPFKLSLNGDDSQLDLSGLNSIILVCTFNCSAILTGWIKGKLSKCERA